MNKQQVRTLVRKARDARLALERQRRKAKRVIRRYIRSGRGQDQHIKACMRIAEKRGRFAALTRKCEAVWWDLRGRVL